MNVQHIPRKLVFIFVVTLASLAVYGLLLAATGQKSPLQDRPQAFIMLPNAFQLIPKADVREAGVKVGEISSVDYEVTDDGVVSKVGVSMNPAYKLYRDARVQLRTKTLANENYVDLDPGTLGAGELREGATLPLARAKQTTQLDDLFGTLDPETRKRVKTSVDSVGAGLEGHGDDFNTMLAASRPFAERGRDVLGLLDGQRDEVGALVQDTSEVLRAFADRTQAVRSLATQARGAAEAAASRDVQLAAAIRELPGTLRQARGTLAHLGDFSGRATPVFADLTAVTRAATPLLVDLRPTADSTRRLLTQLQPSLTRARPLIGELPAFSRKLRPVIPRLDALLRQANPALEFLVPYAGSIGTFFATNGDAFDGLRDEAGSIGRVFPIGSASFVTGIPDEVKVALDVLQEMGAVGASGRGEAVNPLPRPGTNADPQPFDGQYPRITAAPKRSR